VQEEFLPSKDFLWEKRGFLDMRSVKTSNGDSILIVKKDAEKPTDQIWFTEEEWAWAQRIGKSKTDPQEQKDFFNGLVEMKKENPNWCLFTNFPEVSGEKADPNPTPNSPSDSNARKDNTKRRSFPGDHICREILKSLKPGKSEESA
jgi:hypothetical protein